MPHIGPTQIKIKGIKVEKSDVQILHCRNRACINFAKCSKSKCRSRNAEIKLLMRSQRSRYAIVCMGRSKMHEYAWQISIQNARNKCRNQNAEIKLRRTGLKEAAMQQIEQIKGNIKASISNRNARNQSAKTPISRLPLQSRFCGILQRHHQSWGNHGSQSCKQSQK
jgi:hypothetical protein